jgi:hypothetical protein
MPIDFPNNPTIGQQFTSGNNTWEWTGAVWNLVPFQVPMLVPSGGDTDDVLMKNSNNNYDTSFKPMTWSKVTNKPTEFPPSPHTHVLADITDAQPALDAKVPYTGATSNLQLGEFGAEAGFVTFDTTPTNTPVTQGTTSWDTDDNTLKVVLNGYIMKVGEDQFYPVKNQSGNNIAKGTAVRFAGTVGNSGRLLIVPFLADGSISSTFFMGVTAEDIDDGEDGKVLWFGRVRGINTNAYNEGDVLYASTTVAGGFQTTVPVAPNNIVQIAAVVTKSSTVGTIFVRPTVGSNINKDEGVKIANPVAGQILEYQSNGLWENVTPIDQLQIALTAQMFN